MTISPTQLGFALALLASFLFSLKPIFIKEAYALGADSETLMVLRMWLALPFYLVMLAIQRKQLSQHLRHLPSIIGLGFIGYFLSSYLDLMALESISAQAERIILYAYPSLVVLFKAVQDRQLPSSRTLIFCGVVYAGLLFLLPGELNLSGSPTGLFLMLGCACSFALYVLLSKPVIQSVGVGLFTSCAMIASVGFTQLNFIHIDLADIQALSAPVFGYGMALAFVSTVIPSYAMSAAIQKIGAEHTAITGATGPVFTTLLAVIFLGEVLTIHHTVGLAFVILGVYAMGRSRV